MVILPKELISSALNRGNNHQQDASHFTYFSETMILSVTDPLKKYIKRLETHVHNRLERKGLTDFRSGMTGQCHV